MLKKEIIVFNANEKQFDVCTLEADLIAREMSPLLYSQGVRSLLQNWRQGTAKCKTRSEVSFSRKKPWKQKGTGRARAGTARSPLWRKGGVIHGPQPRTREIEINKKQKRLVFNNILASKLQEKLVYCLALEQNQGPQTSLLAKTLRDMKLLGEKILVFLSFSDEKTYMSLRNIEGLNVVYFDQPNVIDLTDCRYWLFLKKDKALFEEMVARWN